MYKMLIDGFLLDANDHVAVLNPADESIVAEAPEADTGVVDAAVVAASNAYRGWCVTSHAQRRAVLLAYTALQIVNVNKAN